MIFLFHTQKIDVSNNLRLKGLSSGREGEQSSLIKWASCRQTQLNFSSLVVLNFSGTPSWSLNFFHKVKKALSRPTSLSWFYSPEIAIYYPYHQIAMIDHTAAILNIVTKLSECQLNFLCSAGIQNFIDTNNNSMNGQLAMLINIQVMVILIYLYPCFTVMGSAIFPTFPS